MGKDCEKRHQSVSACRGISPEALHLLVSYSWPGNVRELENAIERGIALGVTPDIRPTQRVPEVSTFTQNISAADAAHSM